MAAEDLPLSAASIRSRLLRLLGAAKTRIGRPALFAALVLVSSAVVFTLRLIPNLASPGAGADYGHYLIAANWYAGSDNSGEGPFDPPFVPLLVLILEFPFGKLAAIHILGPLAGASLVPCSAYFLARFVPRWVALAGSIVFALWQTFTEFIAFGGATNLFGIAFSLLFFGQMFVALQQRQLGWRPSRLELTSSLLLLLVLSTHHFSLLLTGFTAIVWLALEVVRHWAQWRATVATFGRVVGLAALPGLVYLPYLLSLVEADSEGGFGKGANIAQFLTSAGNLWRLAPELWAPLAAVAALGLLRLTRDIELWPLAASLALSPIIMEFTLLASHPVRTLYFLEFPMVFLACTWLRAVPPAKAVRPALQAGERAGRLIASALLVSLLIVLPPATPAYQAEADAFHHSHLPRGAFQAFDWVSANTGPHDTIAVDGAIAPGWFDGARGAAMGWWLEGYTNRHAIYEANIGLLPFKAKWGDTRNATRLFAGEHSFEDGIVRMADNFPVDDSAMPVVGTGYFNDYHEFVGFGAPRFSSTADGSTFWLNGAAAGAATVQFDAGAGSVGGFYAGPSFSGTRSAAVDASTHDISFEYQMTYSPLRPGDSFGITLYAAPVVVLGVDQFANGSVEAGIPNTFGIQLEKATISFDLENLSAPSLRPGSSVWGKWGYELEWNISSPNFKLKGTVHFTRPSTAGPGAHALTYANAAAIIGDNGVRILFIDGLAVSDIRRFDLQPTAYSRAFSNDAIVIFRVL